MMEEIEKLIEDYRVSIKQLREMQVKDFIKREFIAQADMLELVIEDLEKILEGELSNESTD